MTAGEGEGAANLVLVTFDKSQNVPIERGENAGTTVTYRHAVQGVQTIGMWKGKSLTVELPGSEYAPKKGQGCAVLLQKVSKSGAPGADFGRGHCQSSWRLIQTERAKKKPDESSGFNLRGVIQERLARLSGSLEGGGLGVRSNLPTGPFLITLSSSRRIQARI